MAQVQIQIVHNYDVTEIKPYEQTFKEGNYKSTTDYNTCFHCDAPFKNGDQLYIGTILQFKDNRDQLRFFCETCNGIIVREMANNEPAAVGKL